MVRLSAWQWDRHLQKLELIDHLESNLKLPPIDLTELARTSKDWSEPVFRRVKLSGTYDFEHEMLLGNRRFEGRAGSHVITPMQVDGNGLWVLVDRGFIPLGKESKEVRKPYQRPAHMDMYGLIKGSMRREFLSANDPDVGPGKPWGDAWLRVNIDQMKKQLPYDVLPIYLEVMPDPNDPTVKESIVRESEGGRDDVLFYSGQKQVQTFGMDAPEDAYPIPVHDTTTPPDIHLGYVYEWLFMAVITLGIGIILQMRRPRMRNGTKDTATQSPIAAS